MYGSVARISRSRATSSLKYNVEWHYNGAPTQSKQAMKGLQFGMQVAYNTKASKVFIQQGGEKWDVTASNAPT